MKKKEDNNDLFDVSALIDERFGAPGTPSRIEAEKKAQALLKEEEGITHKSENKIKDYDSVLNDKYGVLGAQSRIEAEEQAMNFYKEQLEK